MIFTVCGFYNHNNLGDEMFQYAIKLLFPNDELRFVELSNINEDKKIYESDGLIVGGGDLMNDFYGIKYNEVFTKFNGYKIAIGVGFSFEECTRRDYVRCFDDIMIRNETDIEPLRRQLGTLNSHIIPDLGFSFPINKIGTNKIGTNKIGTNKIGVFLVGSILSNLSLMFSLMTFINWLITIGYIIELIPMYTESKINDNDLKINEYFFNTFSHTNSIFMHSNSYNLQDFLDKLNYIDYGICIRYHSHVFCTRLGIPFLSIPITRKNEIYVKEMPENTSFSVDISRDNFYNVLSFDIEDAKIKFNTIINNKEDIIKSLLEYSNQKYEFFKTGKIENLVHNCKKRNIGSDPYQLIDPKKIYTKTINFFLSKGINPFTDDPLDILDKKSLNNLADSICYELTLNTANEYVYGTRLNLENKLDLLKDMIYYIYHDNRNKHINHPFNINYIKQDSFKGLHRAGWQYAINSLYCLADDYGIFLDTYLDRTFGWASYALYKNGILPYTNHWVGFFHHTFNSEFSENNLEELFKSELFIASLPLCKGIFCLSEYLAKQIRNRLPGYISVNVLSHPTMFPETNFSEKAYLENNEKKIINIGSWYRNPITIYRIYTTKFKLIALKGKRMESNFCPTNLPVILKDGILYSDVNIWSIYFIKYINSKCDKFSTNLNLQIYDALLTENVIDLRNYLSQDLLEDFLNRVSIIDTLDDNLFDDILTKNIVFLDLVDASVVNTIIECVVRSTPIIINKIPPTIEILGEDYPLFYENVDDIILTDDLIIKTHNYLKNLKTEKYRIDYFFESIQTSEIFKFNLKGLDL